MIPQPQIRLEPCSTSQPSRATRVAAPSGSEERRQPAEAKHVVFDFRRARTRWPLGCELVEQPEAAKLLEAAKQAAAKRVSACAKSKTRSMVTLRWLLLATRSLVFYAVEETYIAQPRGQGAVRLSLDSSSANVCAFLWQL